MDVPVGLLYVDVPVFDPDEYPPSPPYFVVDVPDPLPYFVPVVLVSDGDSVFGGVFSFTPPLYFPTLVELLEPPPYLPVLGELEELPPYLPLLDEVLEPPPYLPEPPPAGLLSPYFPRGPALGPCRSTNPRGPK